MAPERRSRYGHARLRHFVRIHGRRLSAQDTIAGEKTRKVLDSYCPHCATDIRSAAPRRLTRCPNTALCGKPLPVGDDCCPQCSHYTRPGDNFCRVCRSNLRGVVRGRGGLYQQLNRAPSPNQVLSPPREQVQPEQDDDDSDILASDDEDPRDRNNVEPRHGNGNMMGRGGGGGFLRIAAIDDE